MSVGAGDSVHHALELDQHAVAGEFHDPALVLGDLAVDQISPTRLERRKRTALVETHESAVTDHIGSKYCAKSPFHAG